MFQIFLKTISNKKYLLIGMCTISILFIFMYVSIFPTVKEKSDEFSKLLESFPKAMSEVFGMDQEKGFSKLENYITIELFSFVWPIMLIILASVFGVGAIAGEIDRGTMEVLLALPISRTKILISKYLAGLVSIIFFDLLSVYGIVFAAMVLNIEFSLGNYNYLFFICLLFSLAVYSFGIFLSSIFSDNGRGSFILTGILLIMYVLNVISVLKENLENLKYLSFFYYFNPSQALSAKIVSNESIIIFSTVTLVSSILAVLCFKKRDIAI